MKKEIFNVGTGILTSLSKIIQLLETVANCKFI